jgi:hypothetical protein
MKVYAILSVMFVAYLYLAVVSPGSIETGDTYQHYQISRYAIRHPRLLMDHWGRPLFTMLTVPFSQLGLIGMKLFNIIVALFGAYTTYQVAKLLGKPNPHMSVIFILFSVLYIEVILSGLTEPLFCLFLISAIYLHATGKTNWAATICSFSPFVREEGYILICAYATLLILKAKYSSLKYLILGLIIFNILGFIQSGQPAWLITSNTHIRWMFSEYYDQTPHKGPMHYIGSLPASIGTATTALIILGYIGIILEALRRKTRRNTILDEGIMVHSLVVVMLAFHTAIAMTNTFTSLGTLRYLLNTLPCMALIALDGYNLLMQALPRRKGTMAILAAIVTVLVIYNAVSQGRLPRGFDQEQQMFNKVYEWYVNTNQSANVIYDRSPYLDYLLDIDPYDPSVHRDIAVLLRNKPPPDSLIIWDSHHARIGAKMPLAIFNDSAQYRLIKRVDIGDSVWTMNKEKYEVYAFKSRN